MGESPAEPFVGRTQELSWLDRLCRAQRPIRVALLHGPGGLGKTTLVRRWAEQLAEQGVRVSWVDAARLPIGPQGMLRVLAASLGVDVDRPGALGEALARDGRPRALVMDGMETLGDREGWIRDALLPELPADMPVVMVGRSAPGIGWTADAGWSDLLSIHRLEPLSTTESETYLAARGVTGERRRELLDVARGHPLALAVAAESALEAPTRPFRFLDDLHALGRLLERFVQEAPSPHHRAALESACLLEHVTEDLLAAMIGDDAASSCFDWLDGLSFVSREMRGLVAHDLVRECIGTALAANDRGRYRRLVARARDHLVAEPGSTDEAQSRVLLNLTFLLSHVMPVEGMLEGARPFVPLPRVACVAALDLDPSTWSTLERIVAAHEGRGSVRWMRFWRPHSTVRVLRDEDGEVAAFSMGIQVVDRMPRGASRDPVVAAIGPVVERTLARGRGVSIVRLWTSRDAHHGDGPWRAPTMHGLTDHADDVPGVGLVAAPLEPEAHRAALARSELTVFPGSEHQVAGRELCWTGVELEGESVFQWRLRHQSRILRAVGGAGPAEATAPAGFRRSVMEALRALGDPDALASSPLADSAMVRRRCVNGESSKRAEALKLLLVEQHRMFERSQRDEPVRDVLTLTYLSPGGTQREVAEALGLSFSTYRRYLAEGVDRLADALWEREREPS